jgi:PIN domain nuclease of toxin-antitoxin system
MNGFLLDTHYWIWFQQGNSNEIGTAAQRELTVAQQKGKLLLSAISVLEVARLVTEGRVALGKSVDDFVAEAERADGIRILPLTHRILIESTRLPGTIHRDPSDRLLVSTAREHGLTLITRDREILTYAKQGHLKASKL